MKPETNTHEDRNPFIEQRDLIKLHKQGNISLIRLLIGLILLVFPIFRYIFMSGFIALNPKTFSKLIKTSKNITSFASSCLWVMLMIYIPFTPFILIYVFIVSFMVSLVLFGMVVIGSTIFSIRNRINPFLLSVGSFFKKIWYKS